MVIKKTCTTSKKTFSLSPVLLKDGQHTMSKSVVPSSGGSGMLFKFTKKKHKCIGCRAVIDRDGMC